jgi:hypothetical protein
MATRMQQRRGTAQQWTEANPRLAAGEIGLETDTNKFKIGDDVNFWDDLAYFVNSDGLSGELEGFATEEYVDSAIENVVGLAPEALNTLAELADALGDNPDAITTLQSDVAALQAGSGGGSLLGLNDVDYTPANLSDGDVLSYRTQEGQWIATKELTNPTLTSDTTYTNWSTGSETLEVVSLNRIGDSTLYELVVTDRPFENPEGEVQTVCPYFREGMYCDTAPNIFENPDSKIKFLNVVTSANNLNSLTGKA